MWRKWFLRLLHAVGLTNLDDEWVQDVLRRDDS